MIKSIEYMGISVFRLKKGLIAMIRNSLLGSMVLFNL